MIARTVVWWGMLAIATVASGQTTRPAASAADETSSTATRTERLEQLIQRAEEGLLRIRKEIRDYQCVLTKQERVDGKLLEPQNLEVKIRNETRNGDVVTVPFSVYARFTAPAKLKGREVIYVEGQRGGDLLARRGGRRSPNMTLQLAPDSPLAMEGNRYPVTQIGVIIMVERLIEVMQTKVLSDDCVIKIYTDAKLDGRRCTHYEVTMQTRNKSDFMQARLFVDDEYRIPVYYAAYDWPETEGGDPELLEQYAYRRMKLNVGLTDKDFDPANPDYNFSSVKPLPDDAGK
jgi:hypothetical protein